MRLAPGKQIGRYVIEQPVGTGGFGDLYRATGRDDEARTSAGAARQLLDMLADQAPDDMRKSILASREYRGLEI